MNSSINRRVAAFQRKWLCVLGLVLWVSSFSTGEHYCCCCKHLLLGANDIQRPAIQQNCILSAPFDPTCNDIGNGNLWKEDVRTLLNVVVSFSFVPDYFFFDFGSDVSLNQDHSYLFVQEITSKWSN